MGNLHTIKTKFCILIIRRKLLSRDFCCSRFEIKRQTDIKMLIVSLKKTLFV